MYVKYCENKPKSEYIVAEYIDYFEVCTDCTYDSAYRVLAIIILSVRVS